MLHYKKCILCKRKHPHCVKFLENYICACIIDTRYTIIQNMFLISCVNTLATLNAMFVRTFFGVLGLPFAKYFDNLFKIMDPWSDSTITTWMEINKLDLIQRNDSNKKVAFEIKMDDLKHDLTQIKSNPTRGKKCNKSSNKRNADNWFKHIACARKNSKNRPETVTITYKKNDVMRAMLINISDIKDLKVDKDQVDSNQPVYKIKGSFAHKDDSVFDTIEHVRLTFESNHRKYGKHGYSVKDKNDYDGYDSDDSCSSSSDASSRYESN